MHNVLIKGAGLLGQTVRLLYTEYILKRTAQRPETLAVVQNV